MDPRPYQLEACRRTMRVLHKRPVLVSPTGSGKTFMATYTAAKLGARTLWVAHRRELIKQAAKALQRLGLRVGIIMAGEPEDPDAEVQVASVSTLARRGIPDVDLIVIDECHHGPANSYAELFATDKPIIGLTATPFRLDGTALGGYFGELVVAATTEELVSAGYLLAPKVYSHGNLNLEKVPSLGGDYNIRQLGNAVDQPKLIGDIVSHWHRLARGMTTVCFAVNVKHSRDIVQAFTDEGVPAEHLDGQTPADERDAILERLRTGETLIVSNCMVLTEGWDLPIVECEIDARPTQSLCLYLQMRGRVMRPADGKGVPIVLDHAGNTHQHGAVTRPIEYSLTKPVKSKGSAEELGLKRCPTCGLMLEVNLLVCPDCGEELPAPVSRPIEHADGELTEFEDSDWSYRNAFLQGLIFQQEHMNYSDGWVSHRFKERFGEWPRIINGQLLNPHDDSIENKQAVYRSFLQVAVNKGYKPGWASVRYKEVFGCWPRGVVAEVQKTMFSCVE